MDRQSPETNGKIKQTKTNKLTYAHSQKEKTRKKKKKGRMKRGTKKRVIRPINKPKNENKH